MIDQIELENWKTHGRSTLNFVKGTNILIGQMGAGKSSILDAISFALFGTFPSIQRRRINTSEIIRNRPEQKETASVKVYFTINDDKYSVKRTLSLSGGAKAQLEKNGTYVQSQPQRVTEEVERVLKIDYDLFSKAIYSEQNGLEYFLNLRPVDRKKQIDELLGLDKFAVAQENAASVMNKIKDLAEEDDKTAKGFEVSKLKEQLDLLNSEINKIEAAKAASEESLRRNEAIARSHDADIRSLKASYQKKLRLEQEIASNRSRIDLLSKEIAKIEGAAEVDVKGIESRISQARKDAEKAKSDAKNALEAERKAQALLSNINADSSKAKKDKSDRDRLATEQKSYDKDAIKRSITEHSARISDTQKSIAHNRAMKEEGGKWIVELNKHVQKCPVCERELDEQMRGKLISDKSHALKLAEQAIKDLEAGLKDEQKRLEADNSAMNKLTVIEDKLKAYADIDALLSRLDADARKAKADHDKAKDASDAANELLSKKNEELVDLGRRLDGARRRLDMLNQKKELERSNEEKTKEHKEIKADQSAIDLLQGKLTEAVANVSRLMADLKSYQTQESDKRKQISEKSLEIARVESIYEGVRKKRFVAENLSRFRSSLQETQAVLRTRLIGSINSIMNDIWPDLYPYGDYTGIMLDATADDYILKVKTSIGGENAWQNVEAIASGGERSMGCLAMRIAFSLVLAPNLRWLILDEPTHNIDRAGLERFIKMFNEVLPRLIDQSFIITHDPILKQAYNSKVYMLTRDKGQNRETVIEEV
jgi:exonuclease SbcC